MTDTEDQQIRKSDEIKEIIPALAYALAGCAAGTIICFLLAGRARAQKSLAKCKKVANILDRKEVGDTIDLDQYDIEKRNKFTAATHVPLMSLDNLAWGLLIATVGLLYAILFILQLAAMKRRSEDDEVDSPRDVLMYTGWATSLFCVVSGALGAGGFFLYMGFGIYGLCYLGFINQGVLG